MSDQSAIRVLIFSGIKEDWSIWSERFLAKAKRHGYKDVLLGKEVIPKSNEVIDKKTDEGKEMLKIIELNELAYSELVLSMDVKKAAGKVAFQIVKGCKTKEYEDGNAAVAWERLKKKYQPTSAPSLVKLECTFRKSVLKEKEDPGEWITQLEEMRMQLEEMGSVLSDDQFFIHILNNVTEDYALQVALLETRVGSTSEPLTIDEVREKLDLQYERLNNKRGEGNEEIDSEQALLTGQFKGKCRNCGKVGHKAANCFLKKGKQDDKSVVCFYCKKPGHMKSDCFKLKRKQEEKGSNKDTADVVLISLASSNFSAHTWVGDSGASGHYCNSLEGMFDITSIDEEIKVGNGKTMKATKIGKLKCKVVQEDGSSCEVTLTDVRFVPELWVNLFSIGKVLSKGFQLGNDGIKIHVSKNDFRLCFDKVIKTRTGYVLGVDMIPLAPEVAAYAHASKSKFEVNKLHQVFGHCGEECLRLTAKAYNWDLTGKLDACVDCAVGKARQKNVNKSWTGGSKIPGERLFVDISSIKSESYGGAKFWALIVDDYTDFCWSFFLKKKSDLKCKVVDVINELKAMERPVSFVRCDDAGENKSLEQLCKSLNMKVQFEFSGPRTPQRNGRVERKFQTLFGRVRSMLNGAGIKEKVRDGIWAECAQLATHYGNILVTRERSVSPHMSLFGKTPRCLNDLKIFGEMGVVTTKNNIQGKLEDRGKVCMFVGYPPSHACDVYKMFNLETKRIILSRDITWLKKTYGEWNLKGQAVENTIEDEDSDLESTKTEKESAGEEVYGVEETQVNQKVLKEMRKLQGWFNPSATKFVEELPSQQAGRELILDQVDFAFTTMDDYVEPKSFEEAWNHPDESQRQKWRDAIHKEFKDMNNRGVWKHVKKADVPTGRRCVKNKWVFTVKRNGIFRARLVACGYSQVPGIDFGESFAPVVNDITFRILFVAMIVWGLKARIIDVETAFLHGDLEEEIYMDIPKGLNAEEDECLLLLKTIYGLVQAARQFYKKLVESLVSCGFSGGHVDPCLWIKWGPLGVVLIAIYVDDCLAIGDEAALDEVIENLKEFGFQLKVVNDLVDYLSCRIIQEEGKIWILQPHLLKHLEQKFGEEVSGLQEYSTPGTPRFRVVRPKEEMDKIESELQTRYRSGIGMLLFLVKHSRPDIANVVRELSKCADGATPAAYKELMRVIKFVLDTKNHALKIEPKMDEEEWDLVVYSDSDWAGDPDNRISITGFIVYLLGVPICWRSKGQKGATLSSSEAEYVALSEAAKEIKFVYYILRSLSIDVKMPIVVRVDNVGAIFMAENVSTSVRTRHVDTRYHFVREMIVDGFIKIVFVRTIDNDADVFTKNVNRETYDRHVGKFLGVYNEE